MKEITTETWKRDILTMSKTELVPETEEEIRVLAKARTLDRIMKHTEGDSLMGGLRTTILAIYNEEVQKCENTEG